MPLLDIAISQPCAFFGNNISVLQSEARIRNRFLTGYDKRLGFVSTFCWRNFGIKEKLGRNLRFRGGELWRGGLVIQAVATYEITNERKGGNALGGMDTDSVKSNSSAEEQKSSNEDSVEANEKELLRRARISKANKGKVAWNKGRRHSPETLRKIKERTRLAMQDPKLREKLSKCSHCQSEETRLKIAQGVRLATEKRREKLLLQESCLYEWQNLLAVSAQKGLHGEEELQWDSYEILYKQLVEAWIRRVEDRKNNPRPKGSKRAPKSDEQKRKIAAAITAKWLDPGYRHRVYSGIHKYHSSTERKPKAKPKPKPKLDGDGLAQKRSPRKEEVYGVAKRKIKAEVKKLIWRKNKPTFTDPFVSSKLESLRNIREERTAAVDKKRSEAVFRAKLLIAEAKKAADALELAANKNHLAKASLTESRMLIAKAVKLIDSIENEDTISTENENDLSVSPQVEENDEDPHDLEIYKPIKVNGVHSSIETNQFSFNKLMLQDLDAHSTGKLHQESYNGFPSLDKDTMVDLDDPKPSSNGESEKPDVNGLSIESGNTEGSKPIKKWVRGKLVEVSEE